MAVELRTERLLLRPWRDSDRAPFAALNSDPEVMRYFPGLQTQEESDASIERMRGVFAREGWGFWAAELPGEADFIGFIGINRLSWQAHFTPCVDIGWRLARTYWGRGLATEGARAALRFGFESLGLLEIVSITVPDNRPSRHVMEKLGLRHDPAGDFDHPLIAEGHPRRRHVLYRLGADAWRAANP